MSAYGIRVNGIPRYVGLQVQIANGSTTPSLAFGAYPNSGLFNAGNGSLGVSVGGAFNASIGFNGTGTVQVPSGGSYGFSAGAVASAADTFLVRQAANTVEIFDGSTNPSTVMLGNVDFRQTATTFAQTATITNGPRAANPVAWVECKVLGTTGRIPVW